MVSFVPFRHLNIGVLFYEQIQILDSFVLSRNVNIDFADETSDARAHSGESF